MYAIMCVGAHMHVIVPACLRVLTRVEGCVHIEDMTTSYSSTSTEQASSRPQELVTLSVP